METVRDDCSKRQRTVKDLADLTALSAALAGSGPGRLARKLAENLAEMLSAREVRLLLESGGGVPEIFRGGKLSGGADWLNADEVKRAAAQNGESTVRVAGPVGGTLALAARFCGAGAEGGWIAAVFPTDADFDERERVILEVGANLLAAELGRAVAVGARGDRSILETIGDTLLMLDREWRFTYLNRPGARLLKRERDELLGKSIWEEFPALLGTDFEKGYRRAAAEGVAVTVTAEYPDLGGWFEDHIYPTAEGVTVYSRDVTEKKHAEQALRLGEERLWLALEAGRMGVWEWRIRKGELEWSEAVEAIHGLPPGGFGGTFEEFAALIHAEDREMVHQSIQRAVAGEGPYDAEMRTLRPDGSVHWVAGKGRVFYDENGQPERMVGICLDVTRRKRSEQTARFLAAASAELANLVDFDETLRKVASLAVPYFADWVAVDVVQGEDSMRRVAVAHVDPAKVELAHELHRRFPPRQEDGGALWRIVETGRSERVELITEEMLDEAVPDSEQRDNIRQLGLRSYIGVPLKIRGKTIGVLTFIFAESGHFYEESDLTVAEDLAGRTAIAIENAQLYSELREADLRKDEFLATLAHELRNPLAPLRNALEILGMDRLDEARSKEVHGMMGRQVDHLIRLVDDLLDVSRVMRGKIELRKERVDLAMVVARAVETCQPIIETQRHILQIDVPEDSFLLDADPVRLAQVFGNLLTNAARYTPPGGTIEVRAWREGSEAVFSVRDNGNGIDAETLPHVFNLFVQADHPATRAQGGLGIGLTLVKNLVGMHAGSVQAKSGGLGKGAEFRVRLPLGSEPGDGCASSTLPTGRRAGASGNRILVVDDNVDAGVSMGMLLEMQGHEVRVVHDGPRALEVAREFRPALVFLDLGMPGMSGYEVARKLGEMPHRKDTVLVALTGWGQEEDRKKASEAGFDHHLVKPPDITEVEGIVAALSASGDR